MRMRVEPVEIYSDQTNSAVMRHPGRRFPGILIQGGTLYTICARLDELCVATRGAIDQDTFDELNDLREELRLHLTHYKSILLDRWSFLSPMHRAPESRISTVESAVRIVQSAGDMPC